MIRDQFQLPMHGKLIVDLFAGGGGMSTAIEWALGRAPDVAVNHNDDALSMHRANHPQAMHYIADVFEVCPREVTLGQPVGLLHLSPDCTHHSQAAGGQPRDKARRALSWVALRWAGQASPDIITLENVLQILKWGPLVAKRDKATGRVITLDKLACPNTGKMINRIADPGEHIPLERQYLVPDPKRAGKTWRRFIELLRGMGYAVEWRCLCAADFGAPTTRERLFMVARRDSLPITWPDPTHFRKPEKGQRQKRWRAAAECIDWSIPCPSIFDRAKPLADATMRRTAKGLWRYVLDCADPFIVPIAHFNGSEPVHDIREPMRTVTASPKGGSLALVAPTLVPVTHQGGDRTHDITEPMRTITGAHRGEIALATPMLIQMGHGEGRPDSPRHSHGINDIQQPLGTITASAGGHGIATAFLAQANGGFNTTPAHDVREPFSTITNTGSQQQLVAASLVTLRHNSTGRSLQEPMPTITASGEHFAVLEYTLSPEHEEGALRVAAFLMSYYSEGGWGDLREPMATITTRDRLALVTVTVKGKPLVCVDIGLRMLQPVELYRGQGFPRAYKIDRGHDGRVFSKSAQVQMCGNSVSPWPAMALVKANCWHLATWSGAEQHRAERIAA